MIEEGLKLLAAGVKLQASDLYILPQGNQYRIAMNVNGQYRLHDVIECTLAQQLINAMKYEGQMSVSENRRPQKGSMSKQFDGRLLFFRLSTVGDYQNRESLVIRFIYPLKEDNTFFEPTQVDYLKQLCQKRGLIIFAGPTGSGKTTTMYNLVNELAQRQMVLAIEDPIEIQHEHILQLQVNNQAQLTYSELLKTSLRHRPDVLIIGEIRDSETAQAALTAALSGHLVLSTIHSKTSHGVLERLSDFNLAQTALKEALTAVVYQRLVPTEDDGRYLFFNILAEQKLEHAFNQPQKEMKEWQKGLESAYSNGQICYETYQDYYYG